MLYNYIISDAFFLFFKKMKFTNFMEQFRRFFAKFWPFFLPFFKKCRKMVNFHFFEKQKKCIRDYLVIKGLHSPWFWNVDFESVTTLDARARSYLTYFFQYGRQKKIFFSKKNFFFSKKIENFGWPKIFFQVDLTTATPPNRYFIDFLTNWRRKQPNQWFYQEKICQNIKSFQVPQRSLAAHLSI